MSNNPAVTIGITAVDNARGVLQQVDAKVEETAKKVESEGQKMASKSSLIATQFKKNAADIATSVAGLSVGITSFATSFSTLDKAQTAAAAAATSLETAQAGLERKTIGVQQANLAYEKAQQRVNELMTSGKASAEDLAFAQEDLRLKGEKLQQKESELATEQEKVNVATMRLRDAQGQLSDTYTNFLVNIPNQLLGFGLAFNSILKMMGEESIIASIKQHIHTGSMITQTGALTTLTGATHGFRLASILAFIQNPIGIAIIAITTLISIFAFNVGGLRDRIFELGKAIMKFLDEHFKPLADAIRWFIDNVAKPFANFFGAETPTSIETTEDSLTALGVKTTETTGVLDEQKLKLEELSSKYETTLPESVTTSIGSFDKFVDAAKSASSIVDTTSNSVARMAEQFRKSIDKINSTRIYTPSGASFSFISIANKLLQEGKTSTLKALQSPLGHLGAGARNLHTGGELLENVFGFGTETGRPHILHRGETVVPTGKSAGGEVHIHVNIGSKEIAHEIIDDITTLQNRRTRIDAKSFRQELL